MWSGRRHSLFTEQVPVSAYAEGSTKLKDLKDGCRGGLGHRRPNRLQEYLAHKKTPTPFRPPISKPVSKARCFWRRARLGESDALVKWLSTLPVEPFL